MNRLLSVYGLTKKAEANGPETNTWFQMQQQELNGTPAQKPVIPPHIQKTLTNPTYKRNLAAADTMRKQFAGTTTDTVARQNAIDHSIAYENLGEKLARNEELRKRIKTVQNPAERQKIIDEYSVPASNLYRNPYAGLPNANSYQKK